MAQETNNTSNDNTLSRADVIINILTNQRNDALNAYVLKAEEAVTVQAKYENLLKRITEVLLEKDAIKKELEALKGTNEPKETQEDTQTPMLE